MVSCARTPGVHAVVVFRFGQWLLRRNVIWRIVLDPLYLMLNYFTQTMWGIDLPRTARIGPGLYIGHFGGITISGKTVIGSNCNIAQNVTIGIGGSGERKGVPVIGNDVRIAPGARLFGKITVGNNARIGANAVIYKDIPDNAVAVLDPGFKIVSYVSGPARDEHEG
jgi:serine O-acetyltransferase